MSSSEGEWAAGEADDAEDDDDDSSSWSESEADEECSISSAEEGKGEGAAQREQQEEGKPRDGGGAGTSMYRGVHRDRKSGGWKASIGTQGKQQYLGTFDTAAAAARAYDQRAKELHANAVLNFLPDGSLNPDRKIRGSKAVNRPPRAPEPDRPPPSYYRGVRRKAGRWCARICKGGQRKHLGTFDTEEAAARAFDERAKETWSDPILNFLPDGSLNPNRKQRVGWKSVNQPPLANEAKPPSTYRGVNWADGGWTMDSSADRTVQVHSPGSFDTTASALASTSVAARAYDQRAMEAQASPATSIMPDGSPNPDRNGAHPPPSQSKVWSYGGWLAHLDPDEALTYLGVSSTGAAATAAAAATTCGGRDKGVQAALVLDDALPASGAAEVGRLVPAAARAVDVGPLPPRPAEEDKKEKKAARKCTSIYRGVYGYRIGKWQAYISAGGKQQTLGRFDTEEAAARAYDEKAKEVHIDPVLNFLPDGSLNPDRKSDERRPKARGKQPAASTSADRPPQMKETRRSSIYRGVVWRKGKWSAQIAAYGTHKRLGVFGTEEAAARAYDERAKELYESPILNFLPDGSLNPDRKQRVNRIMVNRPSYGWSLESKGPSTDRHASLTSGRSAADSIVDRTVQPLGALDTAAAAPAAAARATELQLNSSPSVLPDGLPNPDRKDDGKTPKAEGNDSGKGTPTEQQQEEEERSPKKARSVAALLWG